MKKIWDKIADLFWAKLEERVELKKVIRNIGWLIGDNLVRLILGVGVGIWMARYLGPDQFGVLSYGLAYVALFSTLVSLGLDNIVVREIVKDKSKTNKILGSTFLLKLISGFVVFLIVLASVFLTKGYDTLTRMAVVIIGGSLIFYAFDTISFWFQSEIKSKFVVYAKLGAFIIASLFRVFFLYTKAPLIAFIWLALAEFILGAIGLIIVYLNNKQKISKWKVDLQVIKKLLSSSWPLIFSGIAVAIYMKIDQIMIGGMLTLKDVGIYSVAVRLSEVWYFIPMAIAGSVFPSIVALRKMNNELYLNRLQIFYDLMAWLAILIAVPVAFFSKQIIVLIYGSQYAAAGPVLLVYIWAGVAVFLGVASEQYLIAENLTKISLARTVTGAILNVLLNLYLIPRYGIIGSAWATLISYFASTFFVLLFRSTRSVFYMFLKTLNLVRVIKFGVSLFRRNEV